MQKKEVEGVNLKISDQPNISGKVQNNNQIMEVMQIPKQCNCQPKLILVSGLNSYQTITQQTKNNNQINLDQLQKSSKKEYENHVHMKKVQDIFREDSLTQLDNIIEQDEFRKNE